MRRCVVGGERVIDSGRASGGSGRICKELLQMTCGRCGFHCQIYPLLVSPEHPPVRVRGRIGTLRIQTFTPRSEDAG
ncbi:unnamed protein product [Litomosoides sigmodontis]|uniref:Uncharacterized protein n=1 Tax=Litomosoides sigmodontis TaxID=42156 RepID=A0A3P6T8X7_LITSI|nr:unnamed protein product [Litomosoides sigmodontis]